jgi:hypothetical protein
VLAALDFRGIELARGRGELAHDRIVCRGINCARCLPIHSFRPQYCGQGVEVFQSRINRQKSEIPW